MNRRLLGAACAFTAAAIWGGMYVVTEVVLEVVPPATLLVLRVALALVVLLGVLLAMATDCFAQQTHAVQRNVP